MWLVKSIFDDYGGQVSILSKKGGTTIFIGTGVASLRKAKSLKGTHKESDGEGPRPNIAYIDELEDARDNFFNDAYDSGLFAQINRLSRFRALRKC